MDYHAAAPAVPREESQVTDRLTTTSYTNSTSCDTLALFLQAMQTQPTHHNITVSPELEIKLLWRPNTPDLYHSINYYSHTIHPCFPLRGTASLIKLSRKTYSEPNQTYKFNYKSIQKQWYSLGDGRGWGPIKWIHDCHNCCAMFPFPYKYIRNIHPRLARRATVELSYCFRFFPQNYPYETLTIRYTAP